MHERQQLQLQDQRLLKATAYINGKWTGNGAEGLSVTNPANGQLLGFVPALSDGQAREAISGARAAFADWRGLLPQARSEILQRWHDLIQANAEDLALLITAEQGKPLHEARGEVAYGASFVAWFAGEAQRMNGFSINGHLPHRDMQVRQEPVGVVAAITPWNFPLAMITRKAAAAMAAGCTVLVRPASETPLTALALAELADRAGFPPGVFNVLTGDNHLAETLCRDPDVAAISFTGSTRVGKLLQGYAADTVKRLSLELGGHAPFIVFDDVALDAAVQGALDAKFQTSGQDCQAANMIFVHERIYEDFLAALRTRVAALRLGDGMHNGTDIGPLMHSRAVAKCAEHVADAREKGARLLAGGRGAEQGPLYYPPTLLADVTADMLIAREETFGPVAAVAPFRDEADLQARMNHPEYGLMAYLYTRDQARIARLTRALDYGMVAVNCVKVTGPTVPFGGVRQSGLGREGGHWGLEEFTELHYVCADYAAAV
ncbi:NAD-dependent succinate-semialdehyde dehydrogenase [Granulosicoccaceae sp. 1_MG-2023]|nr:NAD-dependent succinate-semialdehyde dehydrogenase [Granulosicoccaceae sp. 1_MG-2023]